MYLVIREGIGGDEMAFSDFFKQDLKSRNNIEDVVSSYVTLKRQGKDLVGLCPFHNEKTPSFHVTPSTGSYYCFGCHSGGDVINFIEKIENLDFVEAVHFLADRAGIAVPDDSYESKTDNNLKLKIKEINRETARFYHKYLLSEGGKKGLDYFRSRGLSLNTIRHFGLGYAPESRHALVDHLKELKYSYSEMIQANVAYKSKSGYTVDRFIGRVMFPIISSQNIVIAFGGRALGDEKPKYINTSDTLVYKKSNGLFALNFAKKNNGQLILAEGYMDVIALHSAGFTNAIASLGTALTENQVNVIKRHCTEVVICYDSDAAGQNATQRAIPMLRNAGLKVKVVKVPGNKDPDEFFKANGENGPALFKKLIEESGNDTEYRLQSIKAKYDTTTDRGLLNYTNEACVVLADLKNDIERNIYAGRLAQETNIDKSSILNQVNLEIKKLNKAQQRQQSRNQRKELSGLNDNINAEKRDKVQVSNAEENIIRYLANNPEKKAFIEQEIKPENFVTVFNRKVYEMLLDNINKGIRVDLIDYSMYSQEEMSAVSKILDGSLGNIGDDDLKKNIKIIKNPGAHISNENLQDMSDEAFSSLFKNIGESKK